MNSSSAIRPSCRPRRAGGAAALALCLLAPMGCGDEVIGSDPTEPADACAGFEDDAEEPSEVVVDNDGDETIIVVQNRASAALPFELFSPEGEAVEIGTSSCTCEAQQMSDRACYFSFGGPQFEVTIIPPGGSHTFAWDGLVVERTTMPSQCFADQLNNRSECNLRQRPEAGEHRVQVEVRAGNLACGESPCACDAGQDSCTVQVFNVAADEVLPLEAVLDVGASNRATLTYTP